MNHQAFSEPDDILHARSLQPCSLYTVDIASRAALAAREEENEFWRMEVEERKGEIDGIEKDKQKRLRRKQRIAKAYGGSPSTDTLVSPPLVPVKSPLEQRLEAELVYARDRQPPSLYHFPVIYLQGQGTQSYSIQGWYDAYMYANPSIHPLSQPHLPSPPYPAPPKCNHHSHPHLSQPCRCREVMVDGRLLLPSTQVEESVYRIDHGRRSLVLYDDMLGAEVHSQAVHTYSPHVEIKYKIHQRKTLIQLQKEIREMKEKAKEKSEGKAGGTSSSTSSSSSSLSSSSVPIGVPSSKPKPSIRIHLPPAPPPLPLPRHAYTRSLLRAQLPMLPCLSLLPHARLAHINPHRIPYHPIPYLRLAPAFSSRSLPPEPGYWDRIKPLLYLSGTTTTPSSLQHNESANGNNNSSLYTPPSSSSSSVPSLASFSSLSPSSSLGAALLATAIALYYPSSSPWSTLFTASRRGARGKAKRSTKPYRYPWTPKYTYSSGHYYHSHTNTSITTNQRPRYVATHRVPLYSGGYWSYYTPSRLFFRYFGFGNNSHTPTYPTSNNHTPATLSNFLTSLVPSSILSSLRSLPIITLFNRRSSTRPHLSPSFPTTPPTSTAVYPYPPRVRILLLLYKAV